MDSKDFRTLSDAYKLVYEAKAESPEKEEEEMKKDDDLAGSPNKKKNGKKADKDYDGDGKVESSKDEYFGSRDKAIKKAMGKKVEEAVYGGMKKEKKDTRMVVTNADKKANTPAYQNYKAGNKGYKAADHMKEEQLQEKQKDTPDQVAAVIDMYRSKKGTDAATYDSMHGKKKEAKKERDYAKFERDKMARDAQKAGHPFLHAKGSTTEKEGKKSIKHAHVKDSYDWQRESDLWDEVAQKLTELHEIGGVKFKVVPFDLQEEENWIQGAVKRPGAFTKKAKAAGMSVQEFARHVDANKDKYSTRTEKQANLAQTFSKMKKEGADFDALSSFLVQEGADDQAVNYILANWVEDVRLGKSYDGFDNELLEFVESSLGNLAEGQILDMMESMYHRRNPGKKHPLESGSKKVTPRPVSDEEKKSTDKSDRMYVAMRRVKDRQKGYSKAKSDAADRLHGEYTARQSKRKAGASPKEAAAQSPGAFGSKGFRIKRGGRSGKAPGTDRGTGNKAARRAGQEVKDRDPRK